MKKYFVVSDIHSHYNELVNALNEARFDIDNPNHILIVLGDIFDRGDQPLEVYKFLRGLPIERRVLVLGNHETLLLELVKRNAVTNTDLHNGTYKTLTCFSKDPYKVVTEWLNTSTEGLTYEEMRKKAQDIFEKAYYELFHNDIVKEIVNWIKSPEWVPYYELGKYIFVHAFIPLITTDEKFQTVRYNPNWRTNSTPKELEEAKWMCPYRLYRAVLFEEEEKKGKILVCGHWHTSDFYNELLYQYKPSKQLDIHNENPIFKNEKYPGLIGIDACTYLTKKVNVLVINEDEL